MENEQGTTKDGEHETCIHHWLINEKNFGVCKKCGESKQFHSGSWYDASIRKTAYSRSNKAQQNAPETKR
jgi:hypothetical protein